MTLTVTTVTDAGEARELVDDWNRLADACSAQPTMIPAYALNWWAFVGEGDLELLVARRDGQVAGVLPLHRRSTLGVPFVRWLGHGTGAVGHAIADTGDELAIRALWQAALHRAPAFDLAETLSSELPWLEPVTFERMAEYGSPTAQLLEGWELEDYLNGKVRKRARRELARTRRRLDEGNAAFEMRSANTWSGVSEILDDLRLVYDAAEVEFERLHFLRGRLEGFFRQFLQEACDHGQLDVFVGYVNGEPAAFDLLVTVGEVSHTILGRYHPRARPWGVGHLMMEAMAERALQRGSRRFNLQLGIDDYKSAWSDGDDAIEPIVHITGSVGRLPAEAAVKLRYQAFELRAMLQQRLRD